MDNSLFIVTPYPARPRSPWKLELRERFFGKKIRRFCETEAEAWQLGAEMVAKIRAGGTASLAKKTGVPMRTVTAAWAEHNEDKSPSHKGKVKLLVKRLDAQFTLAEVPRAELAKWFATIKGAGASRAMYYRYLRMFFGWAHRLRYIPEDPTEALDAPKASVGRNILTPDEMKAVLALPLSRWLRACMLLGGFAGLRTEELLRMNWEDIDIKAEDIEIRPGVGKDTGGILERIVDFTEPLKRRKAELKGKGKLVPVPRDEFHAVRRAAIADLGWKNWPDNCLRHSFATYHLAQCKNAGLTAYQMGHTSPSMVKRVYAVPAKKAPADAWWAI